MTIEELFRLSDVIPARIEGTASVSTMTMDSRRAKPGAMFVCMPSKNSDSNAYIPVAQAAGAESVLTFSPEGFEAARGLGMSAALLPEDMYQDSLWKLAKVAFGNPSASMKVIGVTGTNGKTTTAWLIRDMLQALGIKAAYLGTLGFQLPGEERELNNTTPFAIELNELLAEARDKGVEAIAMEVSSHALAEKRVDGIEFDAAVFTNLTQDHLDFHGSMEEYEAAKRRLFFELPLLNNKRFSAVFNGRDPILSQVAEDYRRVLDEREASISGRPDVQALREVDFDDLTQDGYNLAYGRLRQYNFSTDSNATRESALFRPRLDEIRTDLIRFSLENPSLTTQFLKVFSEDEGEIITPETERLHFEAPLGGQYNFDNLAAAVVTLYSLGFELVDLEGVLPLVRPVPGRFEPVPNNAGIGILVDYAHTPDALEKLLDAVRPLTKGRIITVFGCGGDRDRTKRPKMAKAASERSNVTVVTSDNPRTEDPQAILDEVKAGIVPDRESIDIIDRREAIAYAIKIANPGDVVVIAGKGHENYQIIGRTKYPMDDRELAREGLRQRKA